MELVLVDVVVEVGSWLMLVVRGWGWLVMVFLVDV